MIDVAEKLALIVCNQCVRNENENESDLDFSTRLFSVYNSCCANIENLMAQESNGQLSQSVHSYLGSSKQGILANLGIIDRASSSILEARSTDNPFFANKATTSLVIPSSPQSAFNSHALLTEGSNFNFSLSIPFSMCSVSV